MGDRGVDFFRTSRSDQGLVEADERLRAAKSQFQIGAVVGRKTMSPCKSHDAFAIGSGVEENSEPIDLVENCCRIALVDSTPALDDDKDVSQLNPKKPRSSHGAIHE